MLTRNLKKQLTNFLGVETTRTVVKQHAFSTWNVGSGSPFSHHLVTARSHKTIKNPAISPSAHCMHSMRQFTTWTLIKVLKCGQSTHRERRKFSGLWCSEANFIQESTKSTYAWNLRWNRPPKAMKSFGISLLPWAEDQVNHKASFVITYMSTGTRFSNVQQFQNIRGETLRKSIERIYHHIIDIVLPHFYPATLTWDIPSPIWLSVAPSSIGGTASISLPIVCMSTRESSNSWSGWVKWKDFWCGFCTFTHVVG